jgi:hypothetical protein
MENATARGSVRAENSMMFYLHLFFCAVAAVSLAEVICSRD